MSSVLKISEAASLAMHSMVLMAAMPRAIFTTHGIAAALGVSENHLSKVLQRLVRAGLLRSIRGPKGGFKLAKPGENITLLDIFEAVEGKLIATSCLLADKACNGEGCILSDLPEKITGQFREYTSSTTLADLAGLAGRFGKLERESDK